MAILIKMAHNNNDKKLCENNAKTMQKNNAKENVPVNY